jgi:hypothetical protein
MAKKKAKTGVVRIDWSRLYLIKNILQLELRERTAFDVLDSVQLLSHALTVFPPNRRHLLLHKFLSNAGVVPEVDLRADNEARNSRAVVVDFGEPFFANVFKGSGRRDAKAYEEYVGLGI